jgi:molecular chaperone IbpA
MNNFLQYGRYLDWVDDIFTNSFMDFQKRFKSFLPYNFSVNKKDCTARFSMAVAGFTSDDLDVYYTDGILTIKNKPTITEPDEGFEYVHKGLATRVFEFAMPINPLYQIIEARLTNGLLSVEFKKTKPSESTKVEIKTT